ncbi:MAG: DUF4190 domain-containing protein [Chloroflexi bacterium]|nr:DUF4190 domain-containing protein [Chloroflexota bacterium]MBU1751076.1 DUF4190 domain-containing protein [Chloroflexota bacterium]
MFCPNCGATVPEGAAECESCGTRLAPVPAIEAPVAVPAPAPAYAGPAVETSGLAIASMILGVVSLVAGGGMLLIPGVIALVLGYMARTQIRESGGAVKGDELALVGMITGGISLTLGLFACVWVVFGLGIAGVFSCLPLCFLPFMAPSDPSSWD